MSQSKSSNRFRRQDRLLTAQQYSRVFKNPGKSADYALTLLFSNNSADRPRLGLVVAKKQVRLAVNRHRIKRVVRESFREHKNTLGQCDIVVICKKSCSSLTNTKLRELLRGHWEKISQRCK